MSSTSKVTTQIKDLALLKKSLKECGLEFESDAKNIPFYGSDSQDLDIYIRSQKFGFRKQEDGLYELVADSDFRKTYNKVRRTYTRLKLIKEVSKQGFTVAGKSEQLADGREKLIVQRRAFG